MSGRQKKKKKTNRSRRRKPHQAGTKHTSGASELHVLRLGQPVHHDADRHAQRGFSPAVVAVVHVPEPYGGAVEIEDDGVKKMGHLLRERLDAQVRQSAPLGHAGVNPAESFFFSRVVIMVGLTPNCCRCRVSECPSARGQKQKDGEKKHEAEQGERGTGGSAISASRPGSEASALQVKRYGRAGGGVNGTAAAAHQLVQSRDRDESQRVAARSGRNGSRQQDDVNFLPQRHSPFGLTRLHDHRLPLPNPGERRAAELRVQRRSFPPELELSAGQVGLGEQRVHQKVAEVVGV